MHQASISSGLILSVAFPLPLGPALLGGGDQGTDHSRQHAAASVARTVRPAANFDAVDGIASRPHQGRMVGGVTHGPAPRACLCAAEGSTMNSILRRSTDALAASSAWTIMAATIERAGTTDKPSTSR